ncbi:MAG: sigma-54-dependent Fis family transcriptional regulator [Candidatus Omnitrophica bacterium]|nr:sigma-54-dependent Fis family transcriptional regulator [Candidatus Omnitrophota bacterium]
MIKNRILVVDDDQLVQKSLYEMLCRAGYGVDIADSINKALDHLHENSYQVVLLDSNISDTKQLTRLLDMPSRQSRVILLASYGDVDNIVKNFKPKIFDYITRPVEDEKILKMIERSFASRPVAISMDLLREKVDLSPEISYNGLVGISKGMRDIYSVVSRVAQSKATVLLRGESGTGKRMIAHAIHKADKIRKDRPFIEISCGALPREIIESELFGHTKGSFTGATNDRKGRFELANGGTILLDDIDTMPLDLQVKLLRVLQEKEFERIGDHKTIKVDVRIIVSTNQDLEKLIAEKKFREDLYYRVNVISINVPPLRSRKDDLRYLVEHFVRIYVKENHKNIHSVSQDAFEALEQYNWPGNIRELENIIERAVILDTDNIIDCDDFPSLITTSVPLDEKAAASKDLSSAMADCLKDALKEPEKVYILRIMEETGWNKRKAAERLGINRTTLYNKLKKLNIL